MGFLTSLLHNRPQMGMIKALAHFWNPPPATFIFGRNELTPTFKEYDALIGVSSSFGLVNPLIDEDPIKYLSEFMGINAIEIKNVLKGNSNALPFSFLEQKFNELFSPCDLKSANIFLLAFFGFIIFPHIKKTTDPLVAFVVKQVHHLRGHSHNFGGNIYFFIPF